MRVKSIDIYNFRSFEQVKQLELSEINVLIGENNSGKSSILRALQHLQQGLTNIYEDVRVGSPRSEIKIQIENANTQKHWHSDINTYAFFSCTIESSDRQTGICHHRVKGNRRELTETNKILFPNTEPDHFIIPFLSKRKSGYYHEEVKKKQASQVAFDTSNLAAKLSTIGNVTFPKHRSYIDTCTEILGFPITAVVTEHGQRPGVHLDDGATILIDQMGEGVPNIVLLLVNLALSKNKLFLIEEPENDLHPNALKALLDLIIVSSSDNQFVISTHSNIVVSHLCTNAKSSLFKVSSPKGQLPTTATIELIPPKAESRIKVLHELGYAFSDYDMWEGWLLLEEASAEKIIRDYLIPWFAPSLSKIKTVSAGGVSNIESAFADLHRLMLFIHLQPAYAGRAWVRVDGDNIGKSTIEKLQKKFPSVYKDNFSTFNKPQFESYYPEEFSTRAVEVLAITDKQKRREAKKLLLNEVISWIDTDTTRAKKALEKSAKNIIDELKIIENQFLSRKHTTQELLV